MVCSKQLHHQLMASGSVKLQLDSVNFLSLPEVMQIVSLLVAGWHLSMKIFNWEKSATALAALGNGVDACVTIVQQSMSSHPRYRHFPVPARSRAAPILLIAGHVRALYKLTHALQYRLQLQTISILNYFPLQGKKGGKPSPELRSARRKHFLFPCLKR